MKHQLQAPVLELLEKLNPKLISLQELSFHMQFQFMESQMAYDYADDYIIWNSEFKRPDNYPAAYDCDPNISVLHELGHWTMHHTRLGRMSADPTLAMISAMDRNFRCTEEMTAQYSMYYLGQHLGLEEDFLRRNLDTYVEAWSGRGGNRELAMSQGRASADYLIDLAAKNSCKTDDFKLTLK